MKTVQQLYNRLKNKSFEDRYPDYNLNDGKVHIYYISPYLNGTGLYRAILPTLELNKTQTHHAIINRIEDWDTQGQFTEKQITINDKLIGWAHYIVFPATFTDITPNFRHIRMINPNIKIVVDIDDNYHSIPDMHPHHHAFTKGMKSSLLQNIESSDIFTATNATIINSYMDMMNNFSGEPAEIPNLMS